MMTMKINIDRREIEVTPESVGTEQKAVRVDTAEIEAARRACVSQIPFLWILHPNEPQVLFVFIFCAHIRLYLTFLFPFYDCVFLRIDCCFWCWFVLYVCMHLMSVSRQAK